MKILSLSEFIPEEICDTVRFTTYQGDRNISHYCGYMSDFISRVMQDGSIDGCVFPKSCDSSRIAGSYITGTGKFVHQMPVPAGNDDAAQEYLAHSLVVYKEAVEKYYHVGLDDIGDRADRVQARNREIMEIYGALEDTSYRSYLAAVHGLLGKPLAEQQINACVLKKAAAGKRVYLVGSFLSNLRIVDLIEETGLKVVGDNLPESGRLNIYDEDSHGDVYNRIAARILRRGLSPTQNNFNSILQNDREEIKAKGVRGVVFVLQKYCEPYLYLYKAYMKMLDGLGVPAVKIMVSNTEDLGQAEIQLSTFADMI